MSILPKNNYLIQEYEKNKKDISYEIQAMLDTDLFFKMKVDELEFNISKPKVNLNVVKIKNKTKLNLSKSKKGKNKK